jgi:tRNA A37 threonylcarbamoyladenosine dehydratase
MAEELKYDNEYSRLIGAIGKEALGRLQANSVLLVGCKGLGEWGGVEKVASLFFSRLRSC